MGTRVPGQSTSVSPTETLCFPSFDSPSVIGGGHVLSHKPHGGNVAATTVDIGRVCWAGSQHSRILVLKSAVLFSSGARCSLHELQLLGV